MFIIKHKAIFFTISILLVIGSLIFIAIYGLNLGSDFTGGTALEVAYAKNRPDPNLLRSILAPLNLGNYSLQSAGSDGYIIKLKPITEEERVSIVDALSANGANQDFQVKSFSSVGPSVGQELATKGLIAVTLVVLLIILFIAFAFRKISYPVASWKFGLIAIIALIHDITIPTGVFAYLGHFREVEIDALFITALLTILGLSVSDTIVVFDRIRENLKNRVGRTFEETVGMSLDQTITRSLITSLTIISILLVLLFFGGESTRNFALVLTLGMFFGTYSSIFIASPLLVVVYNWQAKP
ncbi:MAG: protein translocase subunit SecF [Patescibacteria group bacterium]